MKDKFSVIIKKIFLSSIASIAVNNGVKAVQNTDILSPSLNENESMRNKENDLSPKLLLKLNKGDKWTLVSHRSHRSHSSHRSHYSSSTGRSSSRTQNARNSGASNNRATSSGTPRSTPFELKGKSSLNNSSDFKANTPNNTNVSSLKLQTTTLKLGDRNLKKGMAGSDVTQLINILLKKGYLKLENGGTQVYGIYLYDETIEATVKSYQKDNKLKVDGNCGPTTIYYLINK